jgi:flavin-dependent dehydrogenase
MKGGRVAVVGGGPAGATCARLLARHGYAAALFEARPSDEKPCGGGVTARALDEFPELADPSLPRRVVRSVSLQAPSGHTAEVEIGDGIHIFKRFELDAFLRRRAEEAGARLHRTRVTGVRRTAGGAWEVATEEGPAGPFEYLVGADGVRSVVRRAVAGPHEGGALTLGIYAYVPAAPDDGLVLRFPGDHDGYLWSFPRTDHASVGICATQGTVAAPRLEDDLRRFAEGMGLVEPGGGGRLKGYHIPADVRPPRGRPGETWALVGDAGGFVDPITREGISHAMRSAAALVEGLVERGEFRTPDLPEELAAAHRLRRGFFRRDFLDQMVRLGASSSAIRRVFADLFSGRQPYRTLRRRLLVNALPCGVEVGLAVLRGFRPERGAPPPA